MDATCTIQDSIHVFSLVHKYVSRILGTYQKSGQSFCFLIKKIIKCSNRASDTDDSKDGSKSNADQMVSEDQTDADGHADVEQIEAVLCKSSAFVNGISNCLYDTVSRIWNDTHVQ